LGRRTRWSRRWSWCWRRCSRAPGAPGAGAPRGAARDGC
jgi:hypothetical protein